MKKVFSYIFLFVLGFLVLTPVIWVLLVSFVQPTQSAFMIERIFLPEKIKTRIEGNTLEMSYKVNSLYGKKKFEFGSAEANQYVMVYYDYGTESGTYEESINYKTSPTAFVVEGSQTPWLLLFHLDGSANIRDVSVNRKSLLTFFNVLTFSNYKDILWDSKFRIWLTNSVIVSLVTAVLSVLLGFFSGYAFSRFKFPGRKISLMWVLATQLFPLAMMIVPFYLLAAKLLPQLIPGFQMVDTRWGLILVYCATALPFSIWMLKGYFDTVPIDLEEAASIDGASLGQLLFLILFPITRPAVFTAFLFAFVQSWNEYAVASMFMSDPDKITLPIGLRSLMGGGTNQNIAWFAAGAVIVSVPVVILFISMKRELVEGATLGAVKG